MTPTLYLTRNGLLEPLGQSQVMAYLCGLSRDFSITLITYEKPEDWADASAMARARTVCEAHGIRWLPQKFRKHPKIIAPGVSMIRQVWLVLREVRQGGNRLIHARSYIPAAAALAVNRITGIPFLFDMRALWPEELITAGRLRRGSLIHRAICWIERTCLRDAAAVVSLTEAAADHLRHQFPSELEKQDITIIPTCTDLSRFRPPDVKPREVLYGCIGTVLSGWFRLDWLSSFFRAAARREPDAQFEVVTRDNTVEVRAAIDPDEFLGDRLSIRASSPELVHEILQRQAASVMFYAGGETSELGRCPTRMGEILGCGLPVIANDGVGDVGQIIRRYRVGVIVAEGSEESMEAALDELAKLQVDPGLSARCRQAAEDVFSLEKGTDAYRKVYAKILGSDVDGPTRTNDPAKYQAANAR